MIYRTMMAALAVALLVSLSAQAQAQCVITRHITEKEAQKEAPFYWIIAGETPEDMKVELKLNFELDQSTPEKLVETYSAFVDARESTEGALDFMNMKRDELKRAGVEALEAKLLHRGKPDSDSEDERPAVKNPKQEVGLLMLRLQPTKVDSTTKLDDGRVQVETRQDGEHVIKRDTEFDKNKWNMVRYDREIKKVVNRYRYTCVEDKYGNWQIDYIEKWFESEPVEGEEESPEHEGYWERTRGSFDYYVWCEQFYAEPLPDKPLKQSTSIEAAESMFTWLVPRAAWINGTIGWAVQKPVYQQLRKLVTQRYYLDVRIRERNQLLRTTPPEVDKAENIGDGIREVRFKQDGEFGNVYAVRLRPFGSVWRIVQVGIYVKARGEDEARFVQVGVPYGGTWE